MQLDLYPSLEQRVERFRSFYRQENQRPLLGFFLGSEYPLFRYEAAESLPEDRPLKPSDFPIDKYVEDSERLFSEHEECGGDFIWTASAFWGIPWLEAALGCPIIANHHTGSIITHPPENFRGAGSLPEFDERNPWISKLNEFITSLAEQSGGRWPIGTTRLRGISDLLAALYGGEQFVWALMDSPDEVSEVSTRLTDFWIAIGLLQIRKIPPFHGGIGSFYYNMWAPRGTIWHQEDASALLSPALYERFIRPYDEQIIQAFSGCIMHQHSVGYVPVEAYLETDLIALEMHIDQGGPSAEDLYPVHTKILCKKPLLIWGDLTEDDLDWVFSELPPCGLAVCKVVRNQREAHDIYRKYVLEGSYSRA